MAITIKYDIMSSNFCFKNAIYKCVMNKYSGRKIQNQSWNRVDQNNHKTIKHLSKTISEIYKYIKLTRSSIL